MTDQQRGGDHLERLEAFLDAWPAEPIPGLEEADLIAEGVMAGDPDLYASDLRAAVEELGRLRAVIAEADDPAPYRRWLTRNLGAAYAAGWETHAELVTGTLATLSSNKREQCSHAWIAERLADLTDDDETVAQEPEPCDGDCDCDCQPGRPCLCPERDCYCGPCPVCGPAPQQPERSGEAT